MSRLITPKRRCGCSDPLFRLDDVLKLSDVEAKRWESSLRALAVGGQPLLMSDWPSPPGALPIGFLDIFGQSHMADNVGASSPDQGFAHKIDGMLQPAIYRNAAISGSMHSIHNQGNCAAGDGGWAAVANEFDRQEQVTGKGATTLTAGTVAGAATALPVSARDNFVANEYVVVGSGATIEVCQVVSTYVGTTGAGNVTVASTANAHASGDPVYHACRNEGWQAKSAVILGGTGVNDLALLGPHASGTFGTTVGASRGLTPFQHSLRFTIAQMRCSVIYRNTHPSNRYGAGFTNADGGLDNRSYPTVYTLQNAGHQQFHNATATTNATITVTTPPDFPGGAACLFFLAYSGGQGGQYSFTVDGSATPAGVTFNGATSGTTALDTRAMNAAIMNEGATLTSTKYTGCVMRIAGLSAGAHTIVATLAAVTTNAPYLGWGMEPQTSIPLLVLAMDPRAPSYLAYQSAAGAWGYGPRVWAGAKTATVSANSTAVTLGSAITVATAGTVDATKLQTNDTITIGTGTTQETRRITAITSSTAVTVDSNFLNAHTGEVAQVGMQDADITGGGFVNPADTQGATSVPGLMAAIRSVTAEFDSMVIAVSLDDALNGPSAASADATNFANDGLHYNDKGAGACAYAVYQTVNSSTLSIAKLSTYTVPSRHTFIGVYLNVANENVGGVNSAVPAPGGGAQCQFANGWQNYFPVNVGAGTNQYPRTGFYKDMRTRMVMVRGAIYGGTDSTIWQMPVGYVPAYGGAGGGTAVIPGWGSTGPGALIIFASGLVQFLSGYPGATGWFIFGGSYIAEGL